jgi:hypothetical protein
MEFALGKLAGAGEDSSRDVQTGVIAAGSGILLSNGPGELQGGGW